jgi:NTE family protein
MVRSKQVAAGEVVCKQGEPGNTMFLVAQGRVQVSIEQPRKPPRVVEYLGRGDHFGEMAVMSSGLRSATVMAVMDSQVLELTRESLLEMLVNIPGFAANLSRSLVVRLRRETARRQRRRRPAIVGIVNSSARTERLIQPLVRALVQRGERIEVLTDRSEKWPTAGDYLVERIPEIMPGDTGAEASPEAVAASVHARIHQVLEHHQRVILELSQKSNDRRLSQLLWECEEILWVVDPEVQKSSLENLRQVLAAEPRLSSRIHLVWILREQDKYSPLRPADLQIASLDFKITLSDSGQSDSLAHQRGVERVVRHLRATRIGLALGGGGARGLAHLGVLRAMQNAGIDFDLLAGTSSGALFGVAYCFGFTPDEAIENYGNTLTPPRMFRAMPGGSRWYLLSKFRLGAWDRMLRHYLSDARLEQLLIPFSTVTVDLVSGTQVIRDRGDAVHCVLESINIPVISRPILRDGMALVDGGILNNLPADILPERGADLIVGVDVAWKLPKNFAGNTPQTPTGRMRRAPLLETLVRVDEVQMAELSSLRESAVDLMIAPDASAFEFADFSKARELADVGEAAAQEVIPQLKQMIADLEST